MIISCSVDRQGAGRLVGTATRRERLPRNCTPTFLRRPTASILSLSLLLFLLLLFLFLLFPSSGQTLHSSQLISVPSGIISHPFVSVMVCYFSLCFSFLCSSSSSSFSSSSSSSYSINFFLLLFVMNSIATSFYRFLMYFRFLPFFLLRQRIKLRVLVFFFFSLRLSLASSHPPFPSLPSSEGREFRCRRGALDEQ